MARSAPRFSATVSPVGEVPPDGDAAYVDTRLLEPAGEEAGRSGRPPTAASSDTGRPRRARPWAVIEAEPPITSEASSSSCSTWLNRGTTSPGQHQVGVGVADDEHPGGTGAGRGLLVDGHRTIVADRVHICPETIKVIALS